MRGNHRNHIYLVSMATVIKIQEISIYNMDNHIMDVCTKYKHICIRLTGDNCSEPFLLFEVSMVTSPSYMVQKTQKHIVLNMCILIL